MFLQFFKRSFRDSFLIFHKIKKINDDRTKDNKKKYTLQDPHAAMWYGDSNVAVHFMSPMGVSTFAPKIST